MREPKSTLLPIRGLLENSEKAVGFVSSLYAWWVATTEFTCHEKRDSI